VLGTVLTRKLCPGTVSLGSVFSFSVHSGQRVHGQCVGTFSSAMLRALLDFLQIIHLFEQKLVLTTDFVEELHYATVATYRTCCQSIKRLTCKSLRRQIYIFQLTVWSGFTFSYNIDG
jgi:hypothetical protein